MTAKKIELRKVTAAAGYNVEVIVDGKWVATFHGCHPEVPDCFPANDEAERNAMRFSATVEVHDEVDRATRKFPRWPSDPIHAAAVIAEECGELQQAVLDAVYAPSKGTKGNIRTEAIQTAAMCLRFLASMDEYEWFHAKQHWQDRSTGVR